ncbi:TonB-dependent receptor [Shewanella sp. C32]|uniref:TonB-dependent receptor n=1 Tax=Shewanella electrica TaxID=515560 RepID=A0ABT2FK46_9GAMM|nr:TonB-dependent receptor [Shewanella electrica]MCH1923522.1 TonB-dependent receptor [Shewanella electrica]MCS4555619.1 TonB-dependent receptor [Shewanella electrica]
MKIKQISLAVFLAMGVQHVALADDIPAAERLTIWGSPVAETSARLDQPTIEQLGKTNVASALAVIPGVALQKAGGRNELQVKVRGFDSRQVPVYYDGIPIYVPYDGNLDLGRFLSSNLESIEVSKGYTSLLQGPNQMGGSINLTTRKPQQTFEAVASYRQGFTRNKTNAYDANLSVGTRNELGYLQFTGSQLKQDFLGLPYGTDNPVAGSDGKMINSEADDKRGIIKLGITPNDEDEYTFTYINQDGSKQNPPYTGNSGQRARYWQWPAYDKESYYYQGITHLGERFTLKSRLYHDEFTNTLMMYNSLSALEQRNGFYSRYDDYSNGAGLQLSAAMREQDQLSFAAHWKEDVHREKDAPDGAYDRYKDRTISLASEYQWAISSQFDAVASVSYDKRESLEGMQHENDGSITQYDDNDQHAFNWQGLVKYHLNDSDALSLSFSDRSRFPTLKERYTTSRPATGQIALVNPHLKAERARALDLTYSGLLGADWSYEASAYYNRVDDAILAINIDANTLQNRNSGRVNYAGVDLGLQGKIANIAEVGLSYSYTHADVKRQEIGVITGLPKHMGNAWFKLTPWQPVSITLAEEIRSSSDSNSDGSQVAAGFAVTNMRVDYQVLESFSINASANNLFDRSYQYDEGFIEQGRNFWLGVELRL